MIILFILTWIGFLLFRTVFIALGLILVPPMAILHKYTTKTEISIINGREIINWKYKFMYIWSNQEDGLEASSEFKGHPVWFRIIYWSAIRNPANNMRTIPFFSVVPNPSKIKHKLYGKIKDINGNTVEPYNLTFLDSDIYRYTTITYQGLYSNLRIQFKMFGKIWRFWIGWKLYPHDVGGLWELDYRRFGAGFATQFKRIHPRKNK